MPTVTCKNCGLIVVVVNELEMRIPDHERPKKIIAPDLTTGKIRTLSHEFVKCKGSGAFF